MESNTKDRRYVNLGNGVQRTQYVNLCPTVMLLEHLVVEMLL